MDRLDQQQPTQIPLEQKHSRTSYSTSSLIEQETRLKSLGLKDNDATRVFQNYQLPDQSLLLTDQKTRTQRLAYKGLIDPEEYVIAIDDVQRTTRLSQIIDEDQVAYREGYKKHKFEGKPSLFSSIEIIVGDVESPETCYRYQVLDLHTSLDSTRMTFTIEPNFEHKKSSEAFQSSASANSQTIGEAQPKTPTTVLVGNNGLSDTQQGLMGSEGQDNFAVGKRTGELISHQRAPQGMTMFRADRTDIEIDLTKNHIWVVALSADLVAENRARLLKEYAELDK